MGLLETCPGYVMTDDYVGYNALALRPGVERLACMARVRRKGSADGTGAQFSLKPKKSALNVGSMER